MHQRPEVSRSVLCSTQRGISSSRSAKPPLCPGIKAPQNHRGEQTPNQKGVSLLGFAVSTTHLGRDFPDEQESTQPPPQLLCHPFQPYYSAHPAAPSLSSQHTSPARSCFAAEPGILLASPAPWQQTHLHF